MDILFETNRFNLSEVKEHFINDCCFGEDVAAWMRKGLVEKGIVVAEPGQEDWGWYVEAVYQNQPYFLGIGGNPSESDSDKNDGEWRIMIEKRRSFLEKLTGKNKMSVDDAIVPIVTQILKTESHIRNIHFES